MTHKELFNICPSFFNRNWHGEVIENYDEESCYVPEGWWGILADVVKVVAEEDIDCYAQQIKEKFGGLRVYVNQGNERIHKAIDEAERLSLKTCQDCGTTEDVETKGSHWVRTLCGECRKNYKYG